MVTLVLFYLNYLEDFAKILKINAQQFASSFQAGVDTAYKAVMKPVEGTILTVAKDAASAAMTKAEETDDCIEVMEYTIEKLSNL